MYDHCRAAINWNFTPQKVSSITDTHSENAWKLIRKIEAIPLTSATFQTAVAPLGLIENDAPIIPIRVVKFLSQVSPDPHLREASLSAGHRIPEYLMDSYLTNKVCCLIEWVYRTTDREAMDPEDRLLLEAMHGYCQAKKSDLTEQEEERVLITNRQLQHLETQFMENVQGSTDTCIFTREELRGLPQKVLDSLRSNGAKDKSIRYHVETNSPEANHVLVSAEPETTRRKMALAQIQRCPENIAIMEDLVGLRHELAQITGHPNHASVRLEGTLAQTPECVHQFLIGLQDRLTPKAQAELEVLKTFKRQARQELGEEVISGDDTIYDWDRPFLLQRQRKSNPELDYSNVSDYFPADCITQGILGVFQTLFGLEFVEDKVTPTWHTSVRTFEVWDSDTQGLMGHLHLDLFPREHKFPNSACFMLRSGSRLPNGTYSTPACAIPEVLKLLSGHYQTGEPISDELLDQWLNYPTHSHALTYLEGVALSIIDQYIYTLPDGAVDIHFKWSAMKEDIALIKNTDAGTQVWPAASQCGIAVKYDARHYSSLWAKIYAVDLFYTRFLKEGILNSQVGREFRLKVLMPGASRDARELMKDFLGREPRSDAFLRRLE
ncbi:hypothetical protein BJ085DRAFT_41312 [Dimargaris cristalligena]|uniref:Peptidase M3A/M3B catalytic domain-containing protein n=1 Tax=Dimargaris cristalligena TaxID=215637 RepID=A0A4P9ZZN3_9FUNG|nr:hypothetical protein BJ085DRAFT_41312 [Dimargaris cristalligena]|eukprot:RKP38290.1 hypothetical protein BJ085DRAFT_41312 [Dimargaris cristalligena]